MGVWAEPGYWFQRLAACRCACIGSCHFPCCQNFCQRAGAIIKRTDPSRKVHALRPLPASPPSVPHRQVPDLDGLSRTACGCKAGVVDLKLVFQFSIRAMRPGGALHSPGMHKFRNQGSEPFFVRAHSTLHFLPAFIPCPSFGYRVCYI